MRKIIDYGFLKEKSKDLDKLAKSVKDALNGGWELNGMPLADGEGLIIQSLVKLDKPTLSGCCGGCKDEAPVETEAEEKPTKAKKTKKATKAKKKDEPKPEAEEAKEPATYKDVKDQSLAFLKKHPKPVYKEVLAEFGATSSPKELKEEDYDAFLVKLTVKAEEQANVEE